MFQLIFSKILFCIREKKDVKWHKYRQKYKKIDTSEEHKKSNDKNNVKVTSKMCLDLKTIAKKCTDQWYNPENEYTCIWCGLAIL